MTDRTRQQNGSAVNPVDSGAFLQSVLDALSAHIAVIDDSGSIVAANAAWRRYGESNGLGSENAGVGINYLEICDQASGEWAEEGKEVASHIREILAGTSTEYRREYPCHSPDEKRWFQVRLTRFRDTSGVKVVAAHESVTEIKKAEEAVRQSEERFRAVFETAQDLMFIKDANLCYTLVNPSVERLLGIEARKIIGRRAEDLFGKETGQHIREVDLRVLEGQTIEEEFTKPVNGAELTFLDTRVPLRDCDGKTTGICVISRDITERRKLQRPVSKTAETYSSNVMQATLKRAQRAASTESTILLLGESGCGKDYLARWIHGHSKRARGPFFSINCAAVSKELAESELFGHEAGAFTGARARKKGLLELAEGGTLLLNEIGELPVSLQAKLLTFLDTKSFLRVGGNTNIQINARLIAATNRNLETEVSEGRFLEALFYRINVFMIRVPPLRERPEDLPALVEDLVSSLAADMQITHIPRIDAAALRALTQYRWPGNVRELRNVVERSLMLWDSGPLTFDLPSPGASRPETEFTVRLQSDKTLHQAVDEVTRFLLLEAVREAGGNTKQAAVRLGISRDTIYRLFRRLGLNREVRTDSSQ